MSDLFHAFILDMERHDCRLSLSTPRSFELFFEPGFPVVSALNDSDNAVVTDVWISCISGFPTITQEFVLGTILEINHYTLLQNQGVFGLDEQMQIVLSRSDLLEHLTVHAYAENLSVMLEQALRLQRLLLMLHPVIMINA
ncbi:hypothetical protein KTQ42_09615|uniref:hypothetical protein n=1 Tax=Noviherbaspirillum sp. L7-7A TaxID=2850560 RepID=UPI001C2BA914|nr:hypothetical protein [Noviherbaspirillum sp. L7-7A]MBV0879557.1 hypothetical protein [Noviherbaspirillum sp. L7-7A]